MNKQQFKTNDLIAFDAPVRAKVLIGRVLSYDPQEENYEVIDHLGCIWTRGTGEVVSLYQYLQSCVDALIKQRKTHTPEYIALGIWKQALDMHAPRVQITKEQIIEHIKFGLALVSENHADADTLRKAIELHQAL